MQTACFTGQVILSDHIITHTSIQYTRSVNTYCGITSVLETIWHTAKKADIYIYAKRLIRDHRKENLRTLGSLYMLYWPKDTLTIFYHTL